MKFSAKEEKILARWYPKEGYRGVQKRLIKAGFSLRSKDSLARAAHIRGIKSNSDGKIKPGQSLRGSGFKLTEEQLEKMRPYQFGQNGKRKAEFFDYALSFKTWLANGKYPMRKWLIKLPSQGRKYHVSFVTWIWQEFHGPVPKNHVVFEPAEFDALVRSMGFSEMPPKEEPVDYWKKLRHLMDQAILILKLITRSEMVSECVNPENSTRAARELSDNYIAGKLSQNNLELRAAIKQQPILLAIKRQQLLNNRKIKSIQNGSSNDSNHS